MRAIIENIIVLTIIAGAGYWILRMFKAKKKTDDGCSCGGKCPYASRSDCPSQNK